MNECPKDEYGCTMEFVAFVRLPDSTLPTGVADDMKSCLAIYTDALAGDFDEWLRSV